MSCEKERKTVGKGSGSESPQGLSPNSRFHRPPGPMEGRGGPVLPPFSNRGKRRFSPRRGAGDGGNRGWGLFSALSTDRRLERVPIDGNGRGAGRAVFRNSGPPTRISKQLIGGNADELRTSTANDGRGRGERLSPSSLPQFPFQSAPPADGGAGEAVSPIGESPPPGEFRPPTMNRRSRPSEGTSLRSSAPLVSRHPARSVNSPMGGAGWPRIFNRPPIPRIGSD